MTLAEDGKSNGPKFRLSVFRKAMKWLHGKGDFTADMLTDEPALELIRETASCLRGAISTTLQGDRIPDAMAERLERDVFVFSGCKTYHELRETSQLLRSDDGQVKPFRQFYNDIKEIHPTYNERYLEAEYEFALGSSQSAAQWADYEQDGDEYDLTYRTTGDGDVRPSHAALDGVTLPASHPFWLEYMTPNGWKCRCRVIQSLQGKRPHTDGDRAMQLGQAATTDLDNHGRNRAEMFRFNPGKEQRVFPQQHPYYNLPAVDRRKIDDIADKQHE